MSHDKPAATRGQTSDLFGRGMIFVVVWAMQMVVATVVSPVLAHVLPIFEFGKLASAIALYQMLIVLAVFGLDQALEMQRVEDQIDPRRARGLLAAGVLFAFVVAAGAWLTAVWWAPALGFDGPGGLVTMTMLWTAPGAAVLMVLSMLQAEDRLLKFCVISLISTVGSQAAGLAFLLLVDRSAVVFAWGGVCAQVAALLLGLLWTRPRWVGIADTTTIRRALSLGIPLVLASMAQFVLTAGDRFAILRWFGPSEVARYQVAFVIGDVMALLIIFTSRAWLPRLKSIVDQRERWQVISEARDGVYRLLGWALLGVTVSSPVLLRVFAPASFRPDSLVPVVYLVGLSAIPIAAVAASSQLLITVRSSRPLAWSALAAVLVKIVATVALIQTLELPGVALATLLAFFAQAWVLRRAVSRREALLRSRRSTLIFLAGMVLLAGVSVLLPQDFGWNIGRFVFSLACLPPFFYCLIQLQRGDAPVKRTRRPVRANSYR